MTQETELGQLIAVEERLPKKGSRVVVVYDDLICLGTYVGDGVFVSDFEASEGDQVTHWMALNESGGV